MPVVDSSLVDEQNYLELRLDDFLERIATGEQAPGGGSAAALTVAIAAGLVAMVARCSRESWTEAGGVAAQALAIRDRAGPLANADAAVWDEAVAALHGASDSKGGGNGDAALELALERAAAVPLEIAQLGADVAELAVHAAESCDGAYRADAAAAGALAAGGARAAAHLVEVNLGVREGDVRLLKARASMQAAAAAVERVLASVR